MFSWFDYYPILYLLIEQQNTLTECVRPSENSDRIIVQISQPSIDAKEYFHRFVYYQSVMRLLKGYKQSLVQGTNTRKVILCVHIETSSLWAEFVNKNRCISVRLITSIPGGTKHLILIIHIIVSYDQNISKIIFVKMDPMSGCKIRLVFTFPPKDSTLQYKKYVHFWITFLALVPWFYECTQNTLLYRILVS